MRKSNMEKLLEAKRSKKVDQQSMTLEEMFLLLLDDRKRKPADREASPTQRAFVMGNDRIKGYMGPKGSAKTSALCAMGWLRALMQPGSKGQVARAHYNDLMDTTGLRMQEMMKRLPDGILLDRDKSPPMKWWIHSIPTLSPEGDIINDQPAQITFMGLQDGMGSYEFNWEIIDEANEVEENAVHEGDGLLRYDDGSGVDTYTIGLAFNPTDTFHWLYTACTGKDHTGRHVADPWVKLYQSVPGENQRNLPKDYYERMASHMPTDMRMRLVEGQWGSTFKGQPVFREFKYQLHTRNDLPYEKHSTLYRFWDFGYRHPYVCWAQFDYTGRMHMLLEDLGENIEIGPFIAKARLKQEHHFPNHRDVYDYGDPAARQKKDTGSTLTELAREHITLRYKISTIDEGLRVCRTWMEKIIDGQAALLFSQRGCPILINALRGGYILGDDGKPEKDGYYDHPVDAWRYGMVNLLGGGMKTGNMPGNLGYQGK